MAGRRLRRRLVALGRRLGALLGAALLLLWRLSCRRRIVDDPRPQLRADGRPYIMALLHAQQLAALLLNDERRLAAMVSRSADGELLVPALRLHRVVPVRGSSRGGQRDKGGVPALRQLQRHLRGGAPALLAVDGPRGPRGEVARGIVALARFSGAVILPVAACASRRWILGRTWDRFEIPKPGATLSLRFAAPIEVGAGGDGTDRDLALRQAVAASLAHLERQGGGTDAAG